jgi:hypothetical protein
MCEELFLLSSFKDISEWICKRFIFSEFEKDLENRTKVIVPPI